MKPRTLGVLVLLSGLGFAWGAVSARKDLFPIPQLAAVLAAARGDAAAASTAPDAPDDPDDPDESAAPVVRPRRQDTEQVLGQLDKLGYLQSYGFEGDDSGVTVYDRERAQPGLNLIVSAHAAEVLLTDMEGEVLHSWRFDFADIPRPSGQQAESPERMGGRYFRRAFLLDDGELLGIYENHGLIKLDRDSNRIWSKLGNYHHDLEVTPDGRIHVLSGKVHVVPRIDETRETLEDYVTTLGPDGEEIRSVSLLEAFENSPYAPLLERLEMIPKSPDIFHTNTLQIFDGRNADRSPLFAAGKALVSIWRLDTIAIVDLERGAVEWALTGMWHRQHQPVLLDNGNILVFDNLGHGGMSKVIEVEPFTQRVVWSYLGDASNDFQSALCGSSQRLANGNTLITESLSGRAFEVTPGGEVVWRYSNPHETEEGVAVLMEVVRLERPLDWL